MSFLLPNQQRQSIDRNRDPNANTMSCR